MANSVKRSMRTVATGFYIARITATGKNLFYTGKDTGGARQMWTRQAPLDVVWLSEESPAKFASNQEALTHAGKLHLDLPHGDRLVVFQLGIGSLTMLALPSAAKLQKHRRELIRNRRALQRKLKRDRGA